jgi:hypothetical protein
VAERHHSYRVSAGRARRRSSRTSQTDDAGRDADRNRTAENARPVVLASDAGRRYQLGEPLVCGAEEERPLARYFYNEARSHIAWTVRINPNDKVNGEIVDLKSIYDAIDTSSLMMVKDAIDKQNSAQFTAAYKTMLESCYSCHKAAGKPMIRPQIPAAPILTIVNNDPAATWPD